MYDDSGNTPTLVPSIPYLSAKLFAIPETSY